MGRRRVRGIPRKRVYDPSGEATSTLYLPPVPERNGYYLHAVSIYNPMISADSTTFAGGPMRVTFPRGGETWHFGSTQFNPDFSDTAVRAELWQTDQKVADLTDFWDPSGEGLDSVTVPRVTNGS